MIDVNACEVKPKRVDALETAAEVGMKRSNASTLLKTRRDKHNHPILVQFAPLSGRATSSFHLNLRFQLRRTISKMDML
jgi:hypothetical protein